MLDIQTKCRPRPTAEVNILSEGQTYNMLPEYPVNICIVIPSLVKDKVKYSNYTQTNWPCSNWPQFGRIRFSVNLLYCPRHPGNGEQQIDTTWDEYVSDKLDWERIDLLVTSERANIDFIYPRSNIGFHMCCFSHLVFMTFLL